jgi:hypothetical protein
VALRDVINIGTLVLAFATFVTVHLALAGRLVLRARPRWHGLAALVLPPLAPIWAFREGWRKTAILWMASLGIYVIALMVALR